MFVFTYFSTDSTDCTDFYHVLKNNLYNKYNTFSYPQIPQICTDYFIGQKLSWIEHELSRNSSFCGWYERNRTEEGDSASGIITFDWGLHWQTRLSWQPPSDVDRWWEAPSPPLFNFIRFIRVFMLFLLFLLSSNKIFREIREIRVNYFLKDFWIRFLKDFEADRPTLLYFLNCAQRISARLCRFRSYSGERTARSAS